MKDVFGSTDLQQITSLGKTIQEVHFQLHILKKGLDKLKVSRPALINTGISQLSPQLLEEYAALFENERKELKIVKFVPSSGAASRMFKVLLAYLDDESLNKDELIYVDTFFSSINKFAFFPSIQSKFGDAYLTTSLDKAQKKKILSYLFTEKRLNLAQLPKGLIPFHAYANETRTAVAEHLSESIAYAKGKNEKNCIHFTVQKESISDFKAEVARWRKINQDQVEVSYSVQDESTNTLAVNEHMLPFRLDDNSILFRPGGHGALLSNLNKLNADVIFMKNIDNVSVDRQKNDTIIYKRAMAGILLSTKKQMIELVTKLNDANHAVSQTVLQKINQYFNITFNYFAPPSLSSKSLPEQKTFWLEKMSAPIRVAGMVKNVGESGGGPFFVKDKDGSVNLQILEQSQLDLKDEKVKKMLKNSTHFNPVDIVCSTLDIYGKKINLFDYRNENTCFIAKKSLNAKTLYALELPGLWNGAMADWNTIFVEVPIATFTPVKTINDLLRKEHQYQ